jgi:hypothetical protein
VLGAPRGSDVGGKRTGITQRVLWSGAGYSSLSDMSAPIADIAKRPVTFDVGDHRLVISKVQEGRWTVAVDNRAVDGSYGTEADAWTAGVREVQRLGGLPR